MNNAKKDYVSPEVNVISVDQDVITVSGDDPFEFETMPDDEPGINAPEIEV